MIGVTRMMYETKEVFAKEVNGPGGAFWFGDEFFSLVVNEAVMRGWARRPSHTQAEITEHFVEEWNRRAYLPLKGGDTAVFQRMAGTVPVYKIVSGAVEDWRGLSGAAVIFDNAYLTGDTLYTGEDPIYSDSLLLKYQPIRRERKE